jgi:hypothetical protein
MRNARTRSLAVLLSACAHAGGTAGPAPPAREKDIADYRDIDIRIMLARTEADVADLLKQRAQVGSSIARTAPRRIEDLRDGLRMGEWRTREAALVSIIERRAMDVATAQIILDAYEPGEPFFARHYAIRALILLEEGHARALSGQVAQVLLAECDESLRYMALGLVGSLEKTDAVAVLVRFLSSGSPRLVLAGYSVARRSGLESEVLGELRRAEGAEALRMIELMRNDLGNPDRDGNPAGTGEGVPNPE